MDEPREERRRSAPRRRVLKQGRIVFNNKHSVIDCTVRNFSETGALLLLKSVIGVPDRFEFEMDGQTRLARVVWKREGQMGIKFE